MDDLGKITVAFELPQLRPLVDLLIAAIHAHGERMADSLDPIRDEISALRTDLVATLDTEISQIADALQAAHQDPAAVLDVVTQLRDLRTSLTEKIQEIIPDTPPEPAPDPGA